MSDEPLFVLLNSYTTGLQPAVLSNLLTLTMPVGGDVSAYEVCLPTDERDIVLPLRRLRSFGFRSRTSKFQLGITFLNSYNKEVTMAKTFSMDDITILHEDNSVLVVVKPQNIPSQGDKSGDADMLTLLKQYVKDKYNKPGNAYLGLVHRLDRPTGGVDGVCQKQ